MNTTYKWLLAAIVAISSINSIAYAATPDTYDVNITARPATITVADVEVSLKQTAADGSMTLTDTLKTDDAGHVTFEDVPQGTYTVSATFAGYEEAESSLVVGNKDVSRTLILESTASYPVTFSVQGGNGTVMISGVASAQGLEIHDTIEGKSKTINLKEGNWLIHATSEGWPPISLSLAVGPLLENGKIIAPTNPMDVDIIFSTHEPTPVDSVTSLDCSMLGARVSSNSKNRTASDHRPVGIPLSLIGIVGLGIACRLRRKRASLIES